MYNNLKGFFNKLFRSKVVLHLLVIILPLFFLFQNSTVTSGYDPKLAAEILNNLTNKTLPSFKSNDLKYIDMNNLTIEPLPPTFLPGATDGNQQNMKYGSYVDPQTGETSKVYLKPFHANSREFRITALLQENGIINNYKGVAVISDKSIQADQIKSKYFGVNAQIPEGKTVNYIVNEEVKGSFFRMTSDRLSFEKITMVALGEKVGGRFGIDKSIFLSTSAISELSTKFKETLKLGIDTHDFQFFYDESAPEGKKIGLIDLNYIKVSPNNIPELSVRAFNTEVSSSNGIVTLETLNYDETVTSPEYLAAKNQLSGSKLAEVTNSNSIDGLGAKIGTVFGHGAGGLDLGTQLGEQVGSMGKVTDAFAAAKTEDERNQIANDFLVSAGKGILGAGLFAKGTQLVMAYTPPPSKLYVGGGLLLISIPINASKLTDKNFWTDLGHAIKYNKIWGTATYLGLYGLNKAWKSLNALFQEDAIMQLADDFFDAIKNPNNNNDWVSISKEVAQKDADRGSGKSEAEVNTPQTKPNAKNASDFSNDPKNLENIDNNRRVGVPSSNGSANFAAGNAQYISVDGNLPAGFGSVQQGNNSTTFTPSFSLQTPNTVLSVPDGNGGVILFDPSKGSPVAALPNLNSGNIDSPGPLKMDWPPPPVAPPVVTPKPPPSQNIQTNSNSTYTTKINNSDGSLSYQITVQNKSDGSSSVTWQSYSYDKSGKLTSTTVDTTNYKSNGDYTNTNTTNSSRPISLTPTKFPKLDDGKPKETCLSTACRLLNPIPIPNSNKLGAGTKKTIEDSNVNKTGAVTALPKIVYGEEVND